MAPAAAAAAAEKGMGLAKKLLHPGIVPPIRDKVLQLPLPPKMKSFLSHPAGPFTVHFWAPTFKWMISIANLADANRPVEDISPAQQTAVAATGIIWSRYSMVIKPKNWNLFSVNVAMFVTGSYQLYRIYLAPKTKTDVTEAV